MNYPNLQNEVKDAERRGIAAGIAQGRRQSEWINQHDLDEAHARGHAKGLVIGSIIGAFLLAAGELALAVIFL